MQLPSFLDWVKPYLPGASKPQTKTDVKAPPTATAGGKSELTANAEKALAMKREAEAEEGSRIPPHRTAHEGMRPTDDPNAGDIAREADSDFTSRRKRTGGARPGETA